MEMALAGPVVYDNGGSIIDGGTDMDVPENPDLHGRDDEEIQPEGGSAPEREEEVGPPRGGLLRDFIRDALVRPGDEIGPYKLLSVLGEGGCGIVYLAEQSQPIRGTGRTPWLQHTEAPGARTSEAAGIRFLRRSARSPMGRVRYP